MKKCFGFSLKLIKFYLIIVLCPLQGYGEEKNVERADTTTITLDELTVEGDNSFLIKNGIAYVPTRNEKKTARNAQDLLMRMGVTQLNVDPKDFSVKTLGGHDVEFFVNGIKDNPDAVWTMEVKRVEFLISPEDPRFMGAKYVLNYIVDKYEYGGYTRFGIVERYNNALQSQGTLFSRMAYKDFTYDVYAGATDSEMGKHGATSGWERFLNPDGRHEMIERKEDMATSDFKLDNIPMSVSGRYNHGNLTASATLSFTFEKRRSMQEGTVYMSGEESEEGKTLSDKMTNFRNWRLYTDAFYFFSKGWSLTYNGTFELNNNHSNSGYENIFVNSIQNFAKEQRFYCYIVLGISKSIGNHHIFLLANGGYERSRIDYSGYLNSLNTIGNPYGNVQVLYGYNTDVFSINIDGSYGRTWNNIDGNLKSFPQITTHIQANYTIDRKNQLSLWGQYSEWSSRKASFLTPAIVRLNDIIYVSGNPNLKPERGVDVDLTYSFIPGGWFSASAYGKIHSVFRHIGIEYSLYDNGKAIMQRPVNSGTFTSFGAGTSLRGYFWNRKLMLSVTPEYNYFHTDGFNRTNVSSFMLKFNGYIYLGSFWLSAYYQSPKLNLDEYGGYERKEKDYYELSAGWGNGNWNVYLGITRFLSGSYKYIIDTYNSDFYSYEKTIYSSGVHRGIYIGATYTFGYGKKIDSRKETNAVSVGSSNILGQ